MIIQSYPVYHRGQSIQPGFPAASTNDKHHGFFLEHSTLILFEDRVKMAGCNSSRFKIKYGVLWCGKLVQLVFKVYVIASHSSALKEKQSSFHDYLSSTIHRHESHI